MHLVQLLLPLYDNAGQAFGEQVFRDVRTELIDQFGGVTAYTRAPADGFWETGTRVQRDQVLVYEVMVDSLDKTWWAAWRETLETRLRQQEIVIRAQRIERL